jgi:hypothetical protein
MPQSSEVLFEDDATPFIERSIHGTGSKQSREPTFRIFYATLIGPGRQGEPGDLWLTQHPPLAYYKAARQGTQKRCKWRLATFHDQKQPDIFHPTFPKFVLSPSSSGPTWRTGKSSAGFGNIEESVMCFFQQQSTLQSLPGSSNNPIAV